MSKAVSRKKKSDSSGNTSLVFRTFTFFITAPYESIDEPSIMACPFHPPPSPGRPWQTSSDDEETSSDDGETSSDDDETDTESLATSASSSIAELSGRESYSSVEGPPFVPVVEPSGLPLFPIYEGRSGMEERFIPAPRPPLQRTVSRSTSALAGLLMTDDNDVLRAIPPTEVIRRIDNFEMSASLSPPSATSTPFPDTTTPTLRVKVKKRRRLTFRHGEQRVCVK